MIQGFQPIRQSVARGLAPAHVDKQLPDISGLAPHQDGFVAVTDAKLEDPRPRLGSLDRNTGSFTPIDVDWSATGKARDLEAITSTDDGHYLAVEGSSWGPHKSRLFEVEIGADGAKSERAHVLPDFGQEIEGLVQKPLEDGRRLVVFGGRGGEGQSGRLFVGVLENGALSFSPEGLRGIEVQAPKIGPGQRDISEMHLDQDGTLWASATTDRGDTGPFESAVYRLGRLDGDKFVPAREQDASIVKGTKVEGLTRSGPGFLVGSDDEVMGGQVGFLIARL